MRNFPTSPSLGWAALSENRAVHKFGQTPRGLGAKLALSPASQPGAPETPSPARGPEQLLHRGPDFQGIHLSSLSVTAGDRDPTINRSIARSQDPRMLLERKLAAGPPGMGGGLGQAGQSAGHLVFTGRRGHGLPGMG